MADDATASKHPAGFATREQSGTPRVAFRPQRDYFLAAPLRALDALDAEMTPERWGRALSSAVVNGLAVSKLAARYDTASVVFDASDDGSYLRCAVSLDTCGFIAPCWVKGEIRWRLHADAEGRVAPVLLPGRTLADAIDALLADAPELKKDTPSQGVDVSTDEESE